MFLFDATPTPRILNSGVGRHLRNIFSHINCEVKIMTPLSTLRQNSRSTIASINGDPGVVERLISIGLTVGTDLTIVLNSGKQPLLVYARDTAIVVARKEAENIYVNG